MFVGNHISPQINTEKLVLIDPAFVVLRLAFVLATFIPCGAAEWFARVDGVR